MAQRGERPQADKGGDAHGRKRRRRRSLLNLGIPFDQVDDVLNQTEDAVALGYRVLEETVEEIRAGYRRARSFNEKRKNDPNTPVPWGEIVESFQNLQNIGLDAIRRGGDVVADAIRAGTSSVKKAAETFEQSRDDLESKPPLAGPVFDEFVVLKVKPGQVTEPEHRDIRHRGLTRLRIQAAVSPPLTRLQQKDDKTRDTLKVRKVSFEPKTARDEDFSRLTVDLGTIDQKQAPGTYEGLVVADNFALLIAKLRVVVEG